VRCGEHEASLQQFFVDLQHYQRQDKFINDFDTIALKAPEMSEEFIQQSFVHVGDSTGQKNIWCGLWRVLEMNEVIYHANAWAEDNKSVFIISKQRASQKHDEKTRNKTKAGEGPQFAEYGVMMQVSVKPTTAASHGHTLGVLNHVMRSYCAVCKAGCGMCYHRAGLLYMQYLHWGEGRPTPKPATADFCSWIPGSKAAARKCTRLEPASHIPRQRLPSSNAEAQQKLDRGIKKCMHEGIPAKYDVYGGDESKKRKLDDPRYVSKERIDKLFQCLKAAQRKKKWKNLFGLEHKINLKLVIIFSCL